MRTEFILGVAEALNCDTAEAEAQWDRYSRQLDYDAIREIESEGYARGVETGVILEGKNTPALNAFLRRLDIPYE